LAGSVIFYIWGEGAYVVLLLILVTFNLGAGIAIEKAGQDSRKRIILALSIFANLLILAYFKYANFILSIFHDLTGASFKSENIHLPLGISFFTFQLVSYLIEVYRGSVKAERDFGRLATYIMMFPHLVAGPIVRYTDICDELKHRKVNDGRVSIGLQYFVVGLAQKVLIANTVAAAADHSFGLPVEGLTTGVAWIGILAYTLQIYFDFCGYSNMAIGLAAMLGFHFPRNFDYPYSSKSISEFWRRWHMSLSFWFRDYLYIPLGGSRGGTLKTVRNLAIVFLVTGLWHGAAWSFVFWGAMHGFFVVLERLGLLKVLERSGSLVSRCYTLLVVMVAWVFFRADSFGHAGYYLKSMVGLGASGAWDPIGAWLKPEILVALVAGCIFSFPVLPAILDRLRVPQIRWAAARNHAASSYVHQLPVLALVCGFVLATPLLISSSLNPFLYFRF
jgi:alginate O-acetyltransferase complex protein AlgI